MNLAAADRIRLVQRGRALEYFTVGYNCLEGVVSILAGLAAGSVSLVGFGLDSAIEVTSGAALLWRLNRDRDAAARERTERLTLRIVGWCFLALAAYVLYDSLKTLLYRETPEPSVAGIVIAVVSVVVMPVLARAKRRVAAGIGSAALTADSRQTDFCSWLAGIVLGGLLLNALAGWWWADPVAGLAMAPIIAKEGADSIRNRACGCG